MRESPTLFRTTGFLTLPVLLALCGTGAYGCAHAPTRELPSLPAAKPLAFGADLHEHLTMREALPFYSGEPGSGVLASGPTQSWVNQIDVEGLRSAGIQLVFGAVFPPLELRPGRTKLASAVAQLQALKAFTRRRADFELALTPEAASRAVGRGLIAVVPSLEGAEAIERVEDVDVLYAAGVRCIQLVHFTDNAIADAEDAQFGSVLGLLLDGEDRGLTALGRAAVERMISLGILVDLSHASDRTIRDVLAIAEPAGVPVVYSHAGSAMMKARTLEDDLSRRIAAGGGLLGIGVYRSDFLHPIPERERWEGFQEKTCDEVVAHWRHYAGVVGAEALVFGTDLSSPIQRPQPGGSCPSGLRNARDLPELIAALKAAGVPESALDSMGPRLLRAWSTAVRKASPESMEQAARSALPVDELFDVGL